MSCGVGRRHGLDLMWLWLWPAAVALIGPLAWEPPYAMSVALKKKKKRKKITHFKCFTLKKNVLKGYESASNAERWREGDREKNCPAYI